MFSIIVAAAENGVIGNKGELPWHLPEDLKHFKALTMGHFVLMGRKTYESVLARLGHPLPGRTTLVVTRQKDFAVPEGVRVFDSLQSAIGSAKGAEVFVAGGAEIYREALPFADKIYLTRVRQTVNGDAVFPELPESEWEMVREEEKDEFAFQEYIRRKH